MPAAQKIDDSRGTSSAPTSSSRAIAAACSGPAPPATTSGKSRGSRPRRTLTSRTPVAIVTLTRS